MSARIVAIGLTLLFVPFAALADDIGAGDDIVIEQKPAARRAAPPPPMPEKAVSLPPPGWTPPQPDADDSEE
jgi:hypothetical protein